MFFGLLLKMLMVAGPVPSPAQVFQRVSPSVVVVFSVAGKTSVSQGSGVAVDARTVVTNWHVVELGTVFAVKDSTGSTHQALLVAEDKQRDLALLRLVEGELPAAKLRKVGAKVGETVFAIGAPRGLEQSMSTGIVSAVRDVSDGETLVQTDAAISNGSSGGGLFDDRGQLVGITTLSVKDGQGLNFALPAQAVQRLVASGFSELAAQKTCDVSGELLRAFLNRLTPIEQKQLAVLIERVPCGTGAKKSKTDEGMATEQASLRCAASGMTECWREYAERFQRMRADRDYATGFLLSRELSACQPCSISTGLGAAERILTWWSVEHGTEEMAAAARLRGVTGEDFSAALKELAYRTREQEAAESCALCQLQAFLKWNAGRK